MKMILQSSHSFSEQRETNQPESLLTFYPDTLQLALRPRVWIRNGEQFLADLQDVYSRQYNILCHMLDCRQNRHDGQDWGNTIEERYNLLLPEHVKQPLASLYHTSLLIACMLTFRVRCLEEISWLLFCLNISQSLEEETVLSEILRSEAAMAEFIMMLEELYDVQFEFIYFSCTDTLAMVAKKITALVFIQKQV